jgi:hypothetical protein
MHSDSYEYFNAATLFAEGRAIGTRDNSLLYFPPFYPILLASSSRIGFMTIERAAVLLGAAIFGLNIYLVGYAVRRMTGSAGAALAASLIVMISARSRLDHAEALSDPLFTLLCQISLIALIEFGHRPSRGWMAAATGAAGFSMLTRFVGASTVIAAGLALMASTWRAQMSRATQWRDVCWILAFCALSVVPCLAWIARNQALHGVWAGGTDLFAGDLSAQSSVTSLVLDLGRYWSLSVNPTWWSGVIAAVVVLVALAGLPAQIRGGFERVGPHWIFLAVYAASLLASASVLDARWRSEYALPLFVTLHALLVASCRSLLVRQRWVSSVCQSELWTSVRFPQRQVRPSSSRDTPN